MAKKLKTEDEPDRQHNVAEIKKIIAEVAHNIIRLKDERAIIQAAITEQRGKLKSLGVKAADFNVALRLMELEIEDRNESVDNLKLCFAALGIGGQGDLFPDDEEIETARKSRAGKALDAAAQHLNG